MTDLREVAAFLLGEGELDGVGFGDPHPTERGNYWWRKHLRAALAQPEQEPINYEEWNYDPMTGKQLWDKQPEPEPVAWKDAPSKIYLQVCEESNCDQPFDSHIEISWCQDKINNSDISYVRADIAPPQRGWQGLTDDEIVEIAATPAAIPGAYVHCFARAIEAKLKEKNHG